MRRRAPFGARTPGVASMRPMRVLGICVVCAVAIGCAPARRTWHPQPLPPGAATPSAFAVVALTTPLATAPRDGAPALWPELPAAGHPSFGVFRILGEEDGWAAIETLGDAGPPHCAGSIPALDAFRLRLYVPIAALVPVTQREIVQPFADGTRAELGRGVPLEALPQRMLFRAHLGDVSTVVQLGIADVGTRYLPSPELPRPSVDRALRGDVLAAAVPVLGQTGRVEASAASDVPVYEVTTHGGELLVELRPPCGRLLVRVPSHAVVSASAPAQLAPETPRSGPSVRAGATVRWRDGTPAGVALRQVTLATEAEPVDRLRCFVLALRDDDDPTATLQLCFDRRDVLEPGAGPALLLDDPS